MKIKLNGTMLESNNPLVVEQWKNAGHAEISGEGEKLINDEPQNGEPKRGRRKAQE